MTLEQIKAVTGGQIDINGTAHPFEIVVRDSQSNPNRASEVAKKLILKDKVDIVTAFATPETVNPVSDQCEVTGVPCLTNDAPLEPYFFGRGGDPKKGFEWTYHFFFGASESADAYSRRDGTSSPSNKVVGGAVAERRRRQRAVEDVRRHVRQGAATRSSIPAATTCRRATTTRRSPPSRRGRRDRRRA